MRQGSMLRSGVIALVVLSGGWLSSVDAKPVDVLSQIHDGADAVVVIPSLRQLSDKLVMLAKTLGLGEMMPPDPLLVAKLHSGLIQGIDDNANVALVIDQLENLRNAEISIPTVALLMPVTSVDEFMANFQDANPQQLENGLTRVAVSGNPLFVKPLNEKYMLVGTTAQSLLSYKAAGVDQWTTAQGAVASDYLDKGDLVVLFSPKTIARLFHESLPEIRASMQSALDEGVENEPAMAAYRPLIAYYNELILRSATSLFNDTTGLAMGLTISEAGISSGMSMQFAQGSNLHKIMAQGPGVPGELGQFDLLPDMPWIFISQVNAKNLDQALMLGLIKQCIPADELVPEQAREASAIFSKVLDSFTLYSHSYQQMQLSNAAGTTQMITAMEGDGQAKAIFTQVRDMIMPCVALFNSLLAKADEDKQDMIGVSYVQDALKVDGGITTDTLTVSGKQEIAQIFTQQLGAPELKLHISYNEAGMVNVMGDENLLKQSLAAMQARTDTDARIKMVEAARPNLPANRIAESYMNVPNYLRHVQTMMLKQPNGISVAMMIGMFQLPDDLPPMVNTVSNTAGGIRMDSFVPNTITKAISQKAMMLAPMFMGGGGGGGEPAPDQGNPNGPPPAPF